MTRPGVSLFGVLVFAAVILAIPAGRRPFWSSDEVRYALLAQDILHHGRWFVPELRGQPYLNKPQLYFWGIALVSLPVGRVTELSAAIPSVGSALAGVAGVVAIGRLLWGWHAGLLAGLILTTTPMYFVFGHQVLADVMLNAWMIWALYCLLRAQRTEWSTVPLLGFYVCVGGAVASKGPAGLAALGAALVSATAIDGPRGLLRLRPVRGLAILVLLALPWSVPYLTHSRVDYVRHVLRDDYLAWYFRSGVTARLAQMATVLPNFLPWTVFLAGAVGSWRRSPGEPRQWVAIWTLTLWVLLGLSGTHRARYLLPVYPGLALLTAEFLAVASARGRRRARRLASIAFCIVGVAAAAVIASPLMLLVGGEDRVFVPDTPWERTLIVALLAAAVTVVVPSVRRDAHLTGAVTVALAVGAIMIILGVTYPPRYARAFDVRGLAAAAAAHTSPDAVVIGHPDLRLSYDFYLGRRVVEIGSSETMARLVGARSQDVVITSRQRWAELAPYAARSWGVVATGSVANREMVVVGSRAP